MALRSRLAMQARAQKAARALALGIALALVPGGTGVIPAQAADGGKGIAIELNKLEPNGEACRAYLVVKNAGDAALESLKLDLVMFDRDGVVAKRLAVQAAPLAVGKTSLKVFDIAGHDCAGIGSILLNDVLDCAPEPQSGAGCLDGIAASARGDVPFMK